MTNSYNNSNNDTPEALYERGDECLDRQSWQEAIATFRELILVDPSYEGGWDKLKEAKNRAREFEDLEDLYRISDAYFAKKQLQDAIVYVNRMLNLSEKYEKVAAPLKETGSQLKLRILYAEAMVQLGKKEWNEAIKVFGEITESQSDYRDVRARLEEARGFAHFDRGKWTKAIKAFRIVLMLEPNHKEVKDRLGKAEEEHRLDLLYEDARDREQNRDWKRACELYQDILDNSQRDVRYNLMRAEGLGKLAKIPGEADELWADGKWLEAVNILEKAVELDNRYSALPPQSRRALYSKLKGFKKKLKQQEDTLYKRGIAALNKQDWPQAIRIFRQVLDLNPRHQGAVNQLEQLELKKKMNKPPTIQNTTPKSLASEETSDGKGIVWGYLIPVITGIIGKIVEEMVAKYFLLDIVQSLLLIVGFVMIGIAILIIYRITRSA